MHFLSINTKNATPALTIQDKENDINDPDYQNGEMTMTQKYLKYGKRVINTLKSSENHREIIIF